ncbi:MAG: arginine--tRNA ligase [Steroidobacteraceae bacterium]
MTGPLNDLTQLVRAAARAAYGDATDQVEVATRRSDHADYQADVALALARLLKRNPREIAAGIVANLPLTGAVGDAAVSGPGFINLNCDSRYLGLQLEQMLADPRLRVERAQTSDTVVVDFSSPNLAKEMHAGHLRSTIIGDCLARVLEYLGHHVIRQNHLGDWGTPFGMLIEHLIDIGAADGGGTDVRELSAFYRSARTKFDQDAVFSERARARVVLLQSADRPTLELWSRLIEITAAHLDTLYERLQVRLGPEHVAGESMYNPHLGDIVAELESQGLAQTSDGAVCVFPPGFVARDGRPLPLIVRKQDGGFGYAATDLAALKYRVRKLGAGRVLYVVGAPQSQHLAMVFETARLAGWVGEGVQLEHVAFGSVLGENGKVLRSRAGEAVRLAELLDEAVARARAVVDKASASLREDERRSISETVGVGAVKYADLANDRVRDYVFDWNRMLAFDGNTATYLMYAHARIRSILRRAGENCALPDNSPAPVLIETLEERKLALELLQFPNTVLRVGETLQPHRLCQQLFQIGAAFSGFYDRCPVLTAPPATRSSRLRLCELTARVLACGLELLGIQAPQSM